MNAKEMFEELGYKLVKKTDKVIEYKTSEYHGGFDRVSFFFNSTII